MSGATGSHNPSETGDILWNIAATQNHFLIAELVHSEGVPGSISMRRRYLRIYDADGQPKSPEMPIVKEAGVLIGSDSSGAIYFAQKREPAQMVITKYDFPRR